MLRTPSFGICALVLSLAWAAPLAAQDAEAAPEEPTTDAETEAARASFQAGLELADEGEWEAASARFREALALRDSPAVRTNLAISLAESGLTLEAVAELERVLREPDLDPEVRREVESRRAELTGQLGRLRIALTGAPTDARVTVDGERWPHGEEAALVQAGEVTVALTSQGRELDTRVAEVPAGGEANILFSLLRGGTANSSDDTPLLVALSVGLGLAVVGAAVALTFALLPTQDTRDGDFGTPVLEID
ncbi:MAG: hypothetical protein AB8I08_36450 [Sandaracinaceae bacterium]